MNVLQDIVNSLVPNEAIKTEVDFLLDNRQIVLIASLGALLILLYFTLKSVVK